jgi:hypothetical protein
MRPPEHTGVENYWPERLLFFMMTLPSGKSAETPDWSQID